MLRRLVILLFLLSLMGIASAHQFTPTYPQFIPAYVDGISYTKVELFNKRRDVDYYELGVFTADWKPVIFISSHEKVLQVRYLETKKISVYVKTEDLPKVVYICTESKLRKEDTKDTFISSRICSKVK